MSNILFGIFLCSAVFAAEKIVVQFIACELSFSLASRVGGRDLTVLWP